MNRIKVALLQMVSHATDLAANLAKGEAFCRRAAAMGADVALFPEMWNIGYVHCPPDADGRAAWRALALTLQSEYVTHSRDLARELDMAIALTYLELIGISFFSTKGTKAHEEENLVSLRVLRG